MHDTYDDTYDDIRKAVLDAALPDIAFDGWSEDVLACAGKTAGIDDDMLHLAFAGGGGACTSDVNQAQTPRKIGDWHMKVKEAKALMFRFTLLLNSQLQ